MEAKWFVGDDGMGVVGSLFGAVKLVRFCRLAV